MITLDAARNALFHYTVYNNPKARAIWREFCKNSTQADRIQIFKEAMNDAYRHNHGTKTQFNYGKDSTK